MSGAVRRRDDAGLRRANGTWSLAVEAALPAALAGLGGLALTTERFLFGATVAPWVAALALLAIAQGHTHWLTSRWLMVVGRRSYGLYLWSFPLAWYVAPRLPGPFWVDALAMVGIAWMATCMSWRFVEQPVIRAGLPVRGRTGRRGTSPVGGGSGGGPGSSTPRRSCAEAGPGAAHLSR